MTRRQERRLRVVADLVMKHGITPQTAVAYATAETKHTD